MRKTYSFSVPKTDQSTMNRLELFLSSGKNNPSIEPLYKDVSSDSVLLAFHVGRPALRRLPLKLNRMQVGLWLKRNWFRILSTIWQRRQTRRVQEPLHLLSQKLNRFYHDFKWIIHVNTNLLKRFFAQNSPSWQQERNQSASQTLRLRKQCSHKHSIHLKIDKRTSSTRRQSTFPLFPSINWLCYLIEKSEHTAYLLSERTDPSVIEDSHGRKHC